MADILHLKTLSSGSSYIPTYQVLLQSSWKFSPPKKDKHMDTHKDKSFDCNIFSTFEEGIIMTETSW